VLVLVDAQPEDVLERERDVAVLGAHGVPPVAADRLLQSLELVV
jgi:hypothetical protein